MKKTTVLIALAAALALDVSSAQSREGWRAHEGVPMTFTADRVAVDNVTKAALATGHVHAAVGDITIRGEWMERDAEGRALFHDPTCVTTCSNDVGHTHWNVTGEVEYKTADYVILRNAWLNFYELPILYLPYLYYPLDAGNGFSWMPGYTGHWGAYLLTKYEYNIAGDPLHRDNTWWLRGDTRFDIREKNGLAFGEDLDWNLGDYGRGRFKFYYAWDLDAPDGYLGNFQDFGYWSSDISENRYGFSFDHKWNATERDTVFVRGSYYADSAFLSDFMRRTFFERKSQWASYPNSGVFWEHVENAWALGAEASGRLNDFYEMTERLPEFYLDLNPTPVFNLPFNYESQNRAGWLARRYAEYASSYRSIYGTNPGRWCDYDAFRLDTYHRLTAPFRTFDDVLSAVPRLGYRGTLWSSSGLPDYYGTERQQAQGQMFRSIAEGGATFAARGTAWVDETWSHMIEPYFDILAQEAYYDGRSNGSIPYVFDSLDASRAWEDQFAGRGRNLPYTYYGVTPGVRNAWSALEESGNLRQIVDFDVYAALSFGKTYFEGDPTYGDYDAHKLTELGRPNYGKHGMAVSPGARVRWTPAEDMALMARAEYDADYNTVALGDVTWRHTVSKDFKYDATYSLRDSRFWDFSSSPYEYESMSDDVLSMVKIHVVRVGCEYQPLDWLALGPYLRWDIQDNELDTVGGWIDYLTDCLGFRLYVEYENSYTRIDRYVYGEEWNFGFVVYLRAFGPASSNIFLDR